MTQTVTLTRVSRVRGRADLYLSTGEMLSMPRAMLKERPYRGGTPFDQEAFHVFISERSYPFALEKAISLLALRSRTEKEICDTLRLCAYPEKTIARVMERLAEAGYLNDADFAVNWASARTSKGLGKRRIGMELIRKGVDRETVGEVLSEIGEDEMLEAAMKAARKAASGKDVSSPDDRRKVFTALMRRGFDSGLARKAIQTLQEES